MAKYINADRLNADLDKLVEAMADAEGDYSDGVRFAIQHFIFLLASLQQEQPEVDLEKEYKTWWNSISGKINVEHIMEYYMHETARHFYGLCNRALEEAARHVYESWMGGTMDDVRRDMVELGRVINARKEE